MKKVTLTALALIMTLTLAGCGDKTAPSEAVTSSVEENAGEKLSGVEYYKAIAELFRDYSDSLPDYEELLTSEKYDELLSKLDDCTAALDKFTAPDVVDEYAELRQELIDGVESEKQFYATMREMVELIKGGEENAELIEQKNQELDEASNNSKLLAAIMDLAKQFKSEITEEAQ